MEIFSVIQNIQSAHNVNVPDGIYLIISLVLSIVAIVVTISKDFIMPAISRPFMEITWENDEECVREVPGGVVAGMNSKWIRLRIKNRKKYLRTTMAKGCYVKLIKIMKEDHEISDFNPILLPWVSFGTKKNNLASGETHLVDLAVKYEFGMYWIDSSNFNSFSNYFVPGVRIDELPSNISFKIDDIFGAGNYEFHISIFGDNFVSKECVVRIVSGQKWSEFEYELTR